MKLYIKHFAAILIMIATGHTVYAYDFSATAPSGQTLYFNIINSNQVTVTAPNYQYWPPYDKPTGFLSIPSTVTGNQGGTYSVVSIDTLAFWQCADLTGLSIPNTVVSIGPGAFYQCYGLTGALIIPNSVINIGYSAFEQCNGLSSVSFGNSVSSIGTGAFAYCSGFTDTLVIPNNVTRIESRTFMGCYQLKGIVIPNSVTSIGDGAFLYCNSLTGTITLPSSVTSIDMLAFAYCHHILSIEIPETIASIGEYAFEFVNNVVYTGSTQDSSLWGAKTLNGHIENGLVYPDQTKTMVTGCDCTNNTFVIPTSVTAVGPNAFFLHEGISNIIIPEGVVSLDNNAFYGCSMLNTISLPSTLTNIGNWCFGGDTMLVSLSIPANVNHIGFEALYLCKRLDTINMLGSAPPILDISTEYIDGETIIIEYDTITLVGKTIIVPCGSVNAYRSAAGWNMCNNIVDTCDATESIQYDPIPQPTLTTNAGTIVVEGVVDGLTVSLYDIMGRKIEEKRHTIGNSISFHVNYSGVYIVGIGTLPAQKVIVTK